jgi:hypothetical protein
MARIPPTLPLVRFPSSFVCRSEGPSRLLLRMSFVLGICLMLDVTGALAQVVYNNANISMGVVLHIYNGTCPTGSLVSADCVDIPANDTYSIPLNSGDYLRRAVVRCLDCTTSDETGTGCPGSSEEFQCGPTDNYIRQDGNDVYIDEL